MLETATTQPQNPADIIAQIRNRTQLGGTPQPQMQPPQQQAGGEGSEDNKEAGVVPGDQEEGQAQQEEDSLSEEAPDDAIVSGEDDSDDESAEQDSPDPSFFEQWDATEQDAATEKKDEKEAAPPPDTTQTVSSYQGLAEKLGIEAKSEEDIVNAFKSTREKAFEGVSDELKNAIELDKAGLDYRSYLGIWQIDWSSLDPEQVFLSDTQQYFTDADGRFNKEGFEDYVDGLRPGEAAMQGRKIINQRIREQQEQEARFKHQQEAVKKQREEAIKEDRKKLMQAVDDLSDIAGFKLDDRHRNAIKRQLSEQDGFKKLFTDTSGNVDYGKVASIYAKGIYFDKIVEYQRGKYYNNGKRDVLQKATNANIKTTSEKPNPSQGTKENAVQKNVRILEEKYGLR